MEQKTFPAFGHYVIRNRVAKGEVLNDELYTNGNVTITAPFDTCWLYTKGLVNQVNIETMEVSVRGPGYCNATTKEQDGVWRADFLEDSTVFCVPPTTTKKSPPLLIDELKPFVLRAGQNTTIPHGTKLSLCQGKLNINGAIIPELRQVEFKSGDRVVVAVEDCYGLIFP
jgi:hypothetical protein